MNSNDLSTPQKQVPAGILVVFLLNLKKWVNILIAGLIPIIGSQKTPFWVFWVFVGVVLIVLIIWSYYQWRKFSFQIVGDKFIIRQGILRKEETLIPLDRIQSVNIKQNLIQQLLNIATLQIDTAGSSKKEASIPALKLNFAEDLKSLIIKLKEDKPEEVFNDQGAKPESYHILIQFSIIDILKVGLTENHLRSSLFLFALVAYFQQYSEYFGFEDEENFYNAIFQMLLIIIPISILILFLLSILVSLWRVFFKYFNLTVILEQSGLLIKSGLLKVEENFVPTSKIQYIKWQSNPLRKLLGFKSLAIYQAAPNTIKRKKAIQIPGCKKAQQKTIIKTFYPDYYSSEESKTLRPNSIWQVRLYSFFVGVPLLILLVTLYFEAYIYTTLLGITLLIAVFLVHKYVSHFKVNVLEDMLSIHKGYIFTDEILLKSYKVQNIAVKQSILQKYRGLVSLKIYTAAGNLTLPFIDKNEGLNLVNKLLFKVESSTKSWM